ncbi:hypothetical protein [Psychromonas sp. Urea-02u-13]|uniref:hypothetical protein n=1 Tax=Psychromonas sp. Urea-02u-13 TaxID=2058326 RepID=UPI000C32D1F3|nr:hypothetical protein [Psychromonas sp. Urea-02u-13]PKG37402.1 hypothetical protein CXF74_19055 [Psychromonas sp. Urea-02u-13]
MKRYILTLGFLLSGNVLANEQCYDIIPDGPIQELNAPTISVFGNGEIYANSTMQAQVKVNYTALSGFSFERVTLCDLYTMTPIQEDQQWKVSEIDNGYLHEIYPSNPKTSQDQFVSPNFISFHATRYLNKNNDTADSAEVCAVVSGTQSNGEPIAKTTCIGDNTSSVYVRALQPVFFEFELVKNKIKENNYHRAFIYELHTINSATEIRDFQYGTGAVAATDPIIRIIGSSDHNVLRDTSIKDRISSWVGVWPYEPSTVHTVEMINESTYSVGSYKLPPITPTNSLVTVFLLHQTHKKMYMTGEYLCEYDFSTPSDRCIGYNGYWSWESALPDRLINTVKLIDSYGTDHKFSLTFGTGDNNDDLFLDY